MDKDTESERYNLIYQGVVGVAIGFGMGREDPLLRLLTNQKDDFRQGLEGKFKIKLPSEDFYSWQPEDVEGSVYCRMSSIADYVSSKIGSSKNSSYDPKTPILNKPNPSRLPMYEPVN